MKMKSLKKLRKVRK